MPLNTSFISNLGLVEAEESGFMKQGHMVVCHPAERTSLSHSGMSGSLKLQPVEDSP